MPQKWNDLFKLLNKNNGTAFKNAPPLILAAWDASDNEKIARLHEQLVISEEQGILRDVEKYLHALNETHWYHAGE